MAQQFWVRVGEKIAGPFSSNQIRQLAKEGRLKPTHQVSVDKEKWMPAGKLQGLEFPEKPPETEASQHACPSCGSQVAQGAAICTACGYDFRSGQRVNAQQPQTIHSDWITVRRGLGLMFWGIYVYAAIFPAFRTAFILVTMYAGSFGSNRLVAKGLAALSVLSLLACVGILYGIGIVANMAHGAKAGKQSGAAGRAIIAGLIPFLFSCVLSFLVVRELVLKGMWMSASTVTDFFSETFFLPREISLGAVYDWAFFGILAAFVGAIMCCCAPPESKTRWRACGALIVGAFAFGASKVAIEQLWMFWHSVEFLFVLAPFCLMMLMLARVLGDDKTVSSAKRFLLAVPLVFGIFCIELAHHSMAIPVEDKPLFRTSLGTCLMTLTLPLFALMCAWFVTIVMRVRTTLDAVIRGEEQ